MNDFISRQAAIDAIFSEPLYDTGMKKRSADEVVPAIYEKIKSLPSTQPEIVRCKDCLMHGVCRFEQGLGLDGYCSQAERRTDEKT